MKFVWTVTDEDVSRVRSFVEAQSGNPVVVARKRRNLADSKPKVSLEQFWRKMVSARLSSQQRSGPGSHVARFNRLHPSPLAYAACHSQAKRAQFIAGVLKKTRGIRFTGRIAIELAENLDRLDAGEWKQTDVFLTRLRISNLRKVEIEAADYVHDTFLGFGPKQARNILQSLGLTQYEIPIDSRVTEWLNRFGFPVHLSAGALADRHYYGFVMDGIQILCKRAGVVPCVLDAAIFASFDGDLWTTKNVVY